MPDWFTTARETIKGAATLEPQEFERPCICGEVIRGERSQLAQELTCPNCHRTWLILPRDPYPKARPRSTKPPLLKRLSSFRTGRDQQAASANRDADHSGTSNGVAAPRSKSTRPPRPPLKAQIATRIATAKTRLQARVAKAARPIRLVGVGMIAATLLTGLWMWHRARVDAASATLVKSVPLAEKAIEEHDFVTAERLMNEAARATKILGATDATALEVQQRHRELATINKLAVQTPYDLVAEAEGFVSNPDEWSQRFDATHSGRWVILDAPLSPPQPATPAAGQQSEEESAEASPPDSVYLLEIPLVAGEQSVRFEIPTEPFAALKKPSRAIFAAQYESWRLHEQKDEPATWIVRFRPHTAFLWSSPDIYEAVGFEVDEDTLKTLNRQSKAIGISDKPERVKQAGRETNASRG